MRRLALVAVLASWLSMTPGQAQTLHAFETDSLARIEASHRGKPFVLVLWSMDCEFCQASLKLLSMAKTSRPDLQIVTVSTDPLAEPGLTALATRRLAELGLAQDAWGFGEASPERLRYAIDPRWHGEKPRTYWFDANGQRTAHSGVLTQESIRNWGAGSR
jgi:hypothetical protein